MVDPDGMKLRLKQHVRDRLEELPAVLHAPAVVGDDEVHVARAPSPLGPRRGIDLQHHGNLVGDELRA